MNTPKKIIIFISFLILLFSLESIFLNFTIEFDPRVMIPDEQRSLDAPEEDKSDKPATLEIQKGIVFKIFFLDSLLKEVNDDFAPGDGKLEQTIEKIQGLLISHKISLFANIFIIGLSFSAVVSILYNAWFSVFIARVLLVISFFIVFGYFARSSFLAAYFPIVGIPLLLFHFSVLVSIIYSLVKLLKLQDSTSFRFNSLLLASYNDEENNARPAIKGIGVESKKESSVFKIASHFIYIIFSGILIGNIVYIPLFSLQKHYSSEFGILLFISLILLSIFYVRNYYKIGREEELSTFRNILVSFSFLQYRFVKNLFFILLSTLGVIIFITCLFLLLSLNTVILKNHNVIDKTINL